MLCLGDKQNEERKLPDSDFVVVFQEEYQWEEYKQILQWKPNYRHKPKHKLSIVIN